MRCICQECQLAVFSFRMKKTSRCFAGEGGEEYNRRLIFLPIKIIFFFVPILQGRLFLFFAGVLQLSKTPSLIFLASPRKKVY